MSAGAAYRCHVPADPVNLGRLRMLGAQGRIAFDHWYEDRGRLVLVLTHAELAEVRAAGVQVEAGEELSRRAGEVRAQRLSVARGGGTDAPGIATGFVDQYLDSEGIYARFAALHAEFPVLTTWEDLAEPTSGYDGAGPVAAGPRPVKMLRINPTPAGPPKPGLLLVAGMHAREWVPPLGALEFAEELLRNYDPASADPAVQAVVQLVDGLDILVVPANNPDGIDWSHHDEALWRKNRRPAPVGGCRGVDLNRNFSVYWGESGSSPSSCHDLFHGPSAFSEPETRNLRALAERFPNLWVAVDCHSYGEKIFRPQPTGGSYTASQPVDPWDHAVYQQLEAAINAGVAEASPGKSYITGTTSNHAGTTDEYLFFTHRIFAFNLECALDFQPPIADGVVSAHEVAAAMRALAQETLALPLSFPAPAALAQVIDRSGSMVASGYVDATRANARRLVDLTSQGDSVGVVSFSDTAVTEFPLAALTAPAVAADARTAIDGIVFGGWTSIGAGLQAAGPMLAGSPVHGSIVLLSDGYQNRPPDVAAVLPTLPAGVRVFTIALGPLSDTALLASIAASTGGQFYFAPDELALHEIYNYVRSEVSGDGLVMNDSFDAGAAPAHPHGEWREFSVDAGASELVLALSWDAPAATPEVDVVPPPGGGATVGQLRWTPGAGYLTARLPRPKAGTWRLRVCSPQRLRVVAAAFVRSPVRLRAKTLRGKERLRVAVQTRADGRKLRLTCASSVLVSPVLGRAALGRLVLPPRSRAIRRTVDGGTGELERLTSARFDLARLPGGDPLVYERSAFPEWRASPRPTLRVEVACPPTSGPWSLLLRVEAAPPSPGPPVVRLLMRSFP